MTRPTQDTDAQAPGPTSDQPVAALWLQHLHGQAPGIPPLFAGLCDDAAMFPPGNAPAVEAVSAHRGHRTAWYRDLVGPFLAGAKHLPAVIDEVRALHAAGPLGMDGPPDPISVVVVVPEGPAALRDALRVATGEPGLELVGVELASRSEGTSAEAARAAAEALAGELPEQVAGVIEVRRGYGLGEALDAVADSPFRAKLRTGGTVAEAFPTEEELAGFIVGCVVRGLPFKCTAGLHGAVRHTDPATGFEHHGFLNILMATHTACQGGDVAEVAAVLAERSAPRLAEALRGLDRDAVIRARAAFTGYGTCSIAEPLADLVALDLILPRS